MSDPSMRLDYAALADWIEGRLDPEDAAAVAAAVSSDETLQRTAGWLREFIGTAQAVPMLAPPPIVHQRLMQHFDRWSAERADALADSVGSLDTLDLEAELLFDSRADLATTGLRNTAASDGVVHLVYSCDAADIAVDIVPEQNGQVRLSGQILSDGPGAGGPFAVRTTGPGEQRIALDGDELGRFSVGMVPATTNGLVLRNGHVTIRLSLDLGTGP
jgi:hypothetical protein